MQARRFMAGQGELLALHFSALCLAISSLPMKNAPSPDGLADEPPGAGIWWVGIGACLVVCIASIFLLASRIHPDVTAILPDEPARQLVDGMPGLIGMAALLPWLADFDQSFALYVGNGFKMFLFQAALF